MRGNVAPLYVHLSQNGGTLLEQMRDATNQSKAALVEEGLRMLSRSDLTRLRKQPLVAKALGCLSVSGMSLQVSLPADKHFRRLEDAPCCRWRSIAKRQGEM
jgi:hypothetical protein